MLVLVVGQVRLPPALGRDAASTVDISGSLLYLALPLLAMLVACGVAWVQKERTLETLLAVRPRVARLRRLMTLVIWAGAAPLLVSAVTLIHTQDWAVDRPLYAAVTLPQVLWMCLMAIIGFLVGAFAHRYAAPLLAGVLVLLLIVTGRWALYPLGHSASLAGTTPTTASWVTPLLIMTVTVVAAIIGVGRLPMWASRGGVLVAPAMVLAVVMANPLVPSQEFRQARSGREACTDGPVAVCAQAVHRRWAEATARSAAELQEAAKQHGLTLPVTRIVINAGDTRPAEPTGVGEARVYLDSRNAPVSMPMDQLAQVLVGASCAGGEGQALAAVAAWLSATVTATEESFTEGWPEFAGLSETDKRAFARNALAGVECGGQ
ncbi:hypothetical protein [Janibacter anophelis]|uniref:hypothetical protein n=1 Tax=Janibacter anophelis TaxID=319054 RepID=UPI0012EE7794|nr:hypothetical protein [Janibacter anophelis]